MKINFIYDKYKQNVQNYFLNYELIKYKIIEFYKNKLFDLEDVSKLEEYISSIYQIKINHLRFKEYIKDNFKFTNSSYIIDTNKYDEIKNFKNSFNKLEKIDNQILLQDFFSLINENNNVEKGFIYMMVLDKKITNRPYNYYFSSFCNLIINLEDIIKKLTNSITNLNENILEVNIDSLIESKLIKEILLTKNINKIEDLKTLTNLQATIILSLEYKKFIENIEDYNYMLSNFSSYLQNIIKDFSEIQKLILETRYSSNIKIATLEEIANKYSLTKERIRQIEAKTKSKINERVNYTILKIIFNKIDINNDKYISLTKINEFFKDENTSNIFLQIIYILDKNLKYNNILNIIYEANKISIDEIVKINLDKLPNVITKNKIISYSDFEQNLIKNYYKILYESDSTYIKKYLSEKDIVYELIDEYFIDGYHINYTKENLDYNRLRQLAYDKYHIDPSNFPNPRNTFALIERGNYCQIDKGTYKNFKFCVNLDEELKQRIIFFISHQENMIFYISVYENFKKELNELGINNYFYLKGLIDKFIPFQTKRNYIMLSKNSKTSTQDIIDYIKSFKSIFTINDISKKFIGVKNYTFFEILYEEFENNKLIFLSSNQFIYLDKLNIPDSLKEKLQEIIEETFQKTNQIISCKLLYDIIMEKNKDLLANLIIPINYFSLFSLIKVLFPEYGYHRPLIYKNKENKQSFFNILYNYALSLDSFNKKDLDNYIKELQLRPLNSYLSFMEEMSDNFVQINIDTMLNKNKLNIDSTFLKSFEEALNLYFINNNSLDTSSFNSFALFPEFQYKWNKYLLVGLIRSYLFSKYKITNTTKMYIDTDFIIYKI